MSINENSSMCCVVVRSSGILDLSARTCIITPCQWQNNLLQLQLKSTLDWLACDARLTEAYNMFCTLVPREIYKCVQIFITAYLVLHLFYGRAHIYFFHSFSKLPFSFLCFHTTGLGARLHHSYSQPVPKLQFFGSHVNCARCV